MTAAFRSLGTLLATTSNDQAVGLPSGHALNDILLLLAGIKITGGSTITASTYAQQITHYESGATFQTTLLEKVDGGSETAPLLHSSVTTANGILGLLAAISGCSTTTPLDGVTPLATVMASVTTDSGPPSGVTNNTPGALAVCMVHYDKDSRWGFKVGSDQGFTLHTTPATSYSTTSASGRGMLVCSKLISGSGALITFPSFAPTQLSPSTGIALTFVLKPASSGIIPILNIQNMIRGD